MIINIVEKTLMGDREFKKQIAELAHQLVQIERNVFFGDQDKTKWLPKYQLENAKVLRRL